MKEPLGAEIQRVDAITDRAQNLGYFPTVCVDGKAFLAKHTFFHSLLSGRRLLDLGAGKHESIIIAVRHALAFTDISRILDGRLILLMFSCTSLPRQESCLPFSCSQEIPQI